MSATPEQPASPAQPSPLPPFGATPQPVTQKPHPTATPNAPVRVNQPTPPQPGAMGHPAQGPSSKMAEPSAMRVAPPAQGQGQPPRVQGQRPMPYAGQRMPHPTAPAANGGMPPAVPQRAVPRSVKPRDEVMPLHVEEVVAEVTTPRRPTASAAPTPPAAPKQLTLHGPRLRCLNRHRWHHIRSRKHPNP